MTEMRPTGTYTGTSTDAARQAGFGTPVVTGLFRDRDSAERAYRAAMSRGYTDNDINVVMSDETRQRHFSQEASHPQTELGNKATEGSGVGAAVGGTLGAIATAIAAAGSSLVIPGIGLIVAGPIAGALAGMGAGGLAGGIVGALIGWGIPEERVQRYETGLKTGGILLGVRPRNEEDAEFFEHQWKKNHAEDVHR